MDIWIDTPLELFLVIAMFISFTFAIGIESEQRVRESWLMSLTHKGYVTESELKKNQKEQIADCEKKKKLYFISAFALALITAFLGG